MLRNCSRLGVSDESLPFLSFLRRSRVRRWMKTCRTLTQRFFRGWTFTTWSVTPFFMPDLINFDKLEPSQQAFYHYADIIGEILPWQPFLSSFWSCLQKLILGCQVREFEMEAGGSHLGILALADDTLAGLNDNDS